MASRKLDIVTARAIHQAMRSTLDEDTDAAELVAVSDRNAAVLRASLLRVERALARRWSPVADRAAASLRRAIERCEGVDVVEHAA